MRRLLTMLLLTSFVACAQSKSPSKCVVCREPLTGQFYWLSAPTLRERQPVCESCSKLETVCSACSLPVKANFRKLSDGRLLCEGDAQLAIFSREEAQRTFEEAKPDLFRMFSGCGVLPDRNVAILLVDGLELQKLYSASGTIHNKAQTVGLTHTRIINPNQFEHTIYLLNGQSPRRLMAAVAHEYAHAWLLENLPRDRHVDSDTVEGFCELVAYKLMTLRQDELEMGLILANTYTHGQVHTLLKAERDFQFHRLIDWMKRGAEIRIDQTHVARVLDLKDKPVPAPVWPQVPTRVPDTLVLKGISGTVQRRFALVNNRTLEKGEEGKVRVGNTNVLVRCLEISDRSVVLKLGGLEQKLILYLGTDY